LKFKTDSLGPDFPEWERQVDARGNKFLNFDTLFKTNQSGAESPRTAGKLIIAMTPIFSPGKSLGTLSYS
jgi:hypothetical protein